MSKKHYADRNLKFETLQLHVGQEQVRHGYLKTDPSDSRCHRSHLHSLRHRSRRSLGNG